MKELSLNNCRLDKRYDIRDSLGRGSYAEIFLARDIMASTGSPHCDVVIKALNVFLQDDLDADLERTLVENFQNEALALDRVRHPNVISRLGHGTARDLKGSVFHYLVLEYLSGGNLQNLIRQKKLGLPAALGYIEQICSGLAHAHSRGIIHRDIKPQNLLLTADLKTAKIADFGVARFSVSESPITRVGTNIYAPPEHSPLLSGHTGELEMSALTPAADVYSLAKTAFTLITGESPRAFVNDQITVLPATYSSESWSDALLEALRKATSRDPRERQASVEDFWSDLSRVREKAAEGEYATVAAEITGKLPRPYISRGYTPIAPAAPEFDPVTETSARPEPRRREISVAVPQPAKAVPHTAPSIISPPILTPKIRGRLRRYATFLIFIGIFTGLLYGTASYMRGRGILPEITNPFRSRTAVANTDIYLRPEPNTANDPIGLVTKNSRVRIVNSQNNWYQVDIIQQGRARNSQPNATRGWLNGKYLELEN
jgi:eukaryotic-like serine/threonine-protein kinase